MSEEHVGVLLLLHLAAALGPSVSAALILATRLVARDRVVSSHFGAVLAFLLVSMAHNLGLLMGDLILLGLYHTLSALGDHPIPRALRLPSKRVGVDIDVDHRVMGRRHWNLLC